MKTPLVLSALALVSIFAHAQTATPIWIESTTDDTVGRQLVFATKEAIRRSAALRLVDRQGDARISIHVVTLDPDGNDAGRRTVYSAVWTIQSFHDEPVQMYSTQYVGTCGRNSIDSCAQTLVATTDEQSSMLRRWILNTLDRARK